MDGVLVIDKPAGPTSHDVVARVRRVTGIRKIGHTGTLDPSATGVLPLVFGRATRLARFLSSREKVYEAEIRFGRTTDTYDAAGQFSTEIPAAGATALDRSAVEAALKHFRGAFAQTPPPFSAKKVAGVPAYRLARQKSAIELQPVAMTVHRLELRRFDPAGPDGGSDAPSATVEVECSAGFYVRSLAHDLGQRLGCGAWLAGLRRLRSGEFGIEQAVTLETVERNGPDALRWLVPIDCLLGSFPTVILTPAGNERAVHGGDIGPEHVRRGWGAEVNGSPGAHVRLLDEANHLVAVAEWKSAGELLHPVVVVM